MSALEKMKERQAKRRQLLAQSLGVEDPNQLGSALGFTSKAEKPGTSGASTSAGASGASASASGTVSVAKLGDDLPSSLSAAKKAKLEEVIISRIKVDDDETFPTDRDGEDEQKEQVFKDSKTFLKGTQSENPHNDYCQHFVDTGQRPQNFIRDTGLQDRFEEYPKLKELIRLKDDIIQKTSIPPMYLSTDLVDFELSEMNAQFDVILIEPPLPEYQRTTGAVFDKYWTWDEIMALDIESIAAQRCFIWLWVGSSDGLDKGRECLKKWNFRRCEDICWIKTNANGSNNKIVEPKAISQRTKEHCLMGIKGTVRRSTDGDFIHANVDIDLIIGEEPEYGSPEKPTEIFHLIEHFCLGRRRLHIFGRDSTIRPGWVTIGPGVTNTNYKPSSFKNQFLGYPGTTTGCTERIEMLRPKSPPPKMRGGGRGGRGGRGDFRGRGGPRGGPR